MLSMARNYFLLLLFLTICGQISAQWRPDQIDIIRDHWGVPHIHAPTDAQVSYGLAWAHAEDDFETIQFVLLAAKSMLGLHLGKEGALLDYVVHLLRAKDIVEKNLHKVSPKFLKLVKGYLAGINAYAAKYPKEVFVKKAFPITVQDVFQAYVLQLATMDGADRVITNFHSPQSTLLMMVSAFAGRKLIKKAYLEAKKHDYRFLSYGDAMIII